MATEIFQLEGKTEVSFVKWIINIKGTIRLTRVGSEGCF